MHRFFLENLEDYHATCICFWPNLPSLSSSSHLQTGQSHVTILEQNLVRSTSSMSDILFFLLVLSAKIEKCKPNSQKQDKIMTLEITPVVNNSIGSCIEGLSCCGTLAVELCVAVWVEK